MTTRPAFAHDGIAFGCDYNPEQWSPDVWDEDVRLMVEAGVDLVAVNIFGWSHLEPREGSFDFARLDDVIERLHRAGIRVNLGTGTATPPAWLTKQHPEMLPMVEDGTRRFPGGRQAYCPSSPDFRRASLRLVQAVVDRYDAHPAVEIWHVSNELGCHNALCYCDESAAAFRRWLEDRYQTIDALNTAWGTAFWSQTYTEWAEILPPRAALSARNPAQRLDFHRFSSDEVRQQYRAEAAVIRERSSKPVTTNFMVTAHIENLDYWSWAGDMDVIANDHYLDHRLSDPGAELAFAADLSRGLGQGAPWMLMEHSTGAVNWQPLNMAKEPGQIIRNSMTHVARGADAVCFFQWRASVQGAEKFHSAMLPHAGTDTNVWREVVSLGRTLRQLDEVVGSRVVADAAVIFSWESWWAADSEGRPSQHIGYLDQVHAAYRALHDQRITVDIVAPGADLSAYRLVVIPGLHLIRESEAQVIDEWVRAGGTAVATFYSGIVDQDDRVWTGGYGGPLRDALGVYIEEFAPVPPGATLALSDGSAGSLWSERVRATTAQVEASFENGPAAGSAALTRNDHGDGVVWYVATLLDAPSMAKVMADAAEAAGVRPPAEVRGEGGPVELVRRRSADASFLFVINHTDARISVDTRGVELVTGTSVTETLDVPAGAVRVVREREDA